MNHSSLGGIVGSLHLGEVDDVTTHRGSSYEATVCKVGKLVAVSVRALLFLAAPVVGSGLGTVESAIQVNADNIAVMLEGPIDHGALGPGNTGIGNEDIKPSIEVLDNFIHGLLDSFCVGDLDLVSLGC
jgi:hypothetical protein